MGRLRILTYSIGKPKEIHCHWCSLCGRIWNPDLLGSAMKHMHSMLTVCIFFQQEFFLYLKNERVIMGFPVRNINLGFIGSLCFLDFSFQFLNLHLCISSSTGVFYSFSLHLFSLSGSIYIVETQFWFLLLLLSLLLFHCFGHMTNVHFLPSLQIRMVLWQSSFQ